MDERRKGMTEKNDNLSMILGALDRRDDQILGEIRDLRSANDKAHEKILASMETKMGKDDCKAIREDEKTRLKPVYDILRILAIGLLALAAGGAGPQFIDLLSKAAGIK